MTTSSLDILDVIKPHPRQKEFLRAVRDNTYVLYGGAAGGGKSYILRWALIWLLIKWAKEGIRNVRVGLFCETKPDLRDRHLDRIMFEFPTWLGKMHQTNMTFTLDQKYGGGVIMFRNLDEPEKYRSVEFAAIAIDELTRNKRNVFDYLNSRLRWVGIEDPKFLAATNPGEVGHAWVKKLWIDRDFTDESYNAEDFVFVPAKAYDNPHLPKDYIDKKLAQLPEDLRRALQDGDWDTFEGQYFKDFSLQKHVTSPIYLPPEWERGIAVDWGFADPWCALWAARDPDTKRVYVYREMYAREIPNVEQAQRILTASTYESRAFAVADPSMWARKEADGVSAAEQYAKTGLLITPANNDRIAGWNNLRSFLLPLQDGLPGLQIFDSCENLIRTLPNMVYSKTHPEDLNTKSEDHAVDTLRYLLGAYKLHENWIKAAKKPEDYVNRKRPAFTKRGWSF